MKYGVWDDDVVCMHASIFVRANGDISDNKNCIHVIFMTMSTYFGVQLSYGVLNSSEVYGV